MFVIRMNRFIIFRFLANTNQRRGDSKISFDWLVNNNLETYLILEQNFDFVLPSLPPYKKKLINVTKCRVNSNNSH